MWIAHCRLWKKVSLITQMVKILAAMQETQVQSLGQEEGNGNPLQYSWLENPMDRPWGHKKLDMTEQLTLSLYLWKRWGKGTHTHTHTHTRIHLFVVVDSKFICWSLTPNVTVFGEKTFKEIICESRSWEWGSIQYGWCPYKKRRTPGVHIHREGPRVGTGEEGCLQAKEKGFRRNQPCPHLGLRL